MPSEHERQSDEDVKSSSQTTPTGEIRPEAEDDEVSGYVMSVPTHLQVDVAAGDEDEVQT